MKINLLNCPAVISRLNLGHLSLSQDFSATETNQIVMKLSLKVKQNCLFLIMQLFFLVSFCLICACAKNAIQIRSAAKNQPRTKKKGGWGVGGQLDCKWFTVGSL